MAIEAVPFNPGVWQFLDENGDPYAGGSLTFVQVGTAVAQNVYSDSALTVSLGNVVTLNAAGRTSTSSSGPDTAVYFQQKTYDVTLKNAGGTSIWGPITFSGSQWPGQIQGQAILNPAANANGYANRFTTTIDKASSGVHALFAGTRFDATTVTPAAATLTEASTVYIEGPPTTGSSVYALHVAAGISRFDGQIQPAGGFASALFAGMSSGRLTLTSGTPVTTADVTAAGTLYFAPYAGSTISLYDGSTTWNLIAFTELSIAVPAPTSQMYDVFVYNNAGTATLELTAWTNDTTRATALTTQDGVLVKSGSTTRRYVGSFRTTGVANQTEDSFAKRYVWNYYNRVARAMRVLETTNSWNYSTNTYQQANASTANQLDCAIGVAEVQVQAHVSAICTSNAANNNCWVSIGVNGVTANAGTISQTSWMNNNGAQLIGPSADLLIYPAVGRNFFTWLEKASTGGTATWYGDNASDGTQTGIQGTVWG